MLQPLPGHRHPRRRQRGLPLSWDPAQYERFRDARRHPFNDLLALVRPTPGMRVLDLGCGSGALTAEVHARLGAAETLGIDSSAEMLARDPQKADGLSFRRTDIATFDEGAWDLVFSNAALHWVPDHAALFGRLRRLLRPGGQLAVQVPANHDHPSHRVADAVAAQEPFRTVLGGYQRGTPVESPAWYDRTLRALGFTTRHVRLQLYPCELPSVDEVVEWVKGSLLTAYQARMPAPLFDDFVAAYRTRLRATLPDDRPFYYPYERILMWAALP